MSVKINERKLYISFATLVYQMRDGDVTPEDLDKALFYFTCSRDYLDLGMMKNSTIRRAFHMYDYEDSEMHLINDAEHIRDPEGARRIYALIREVVFKAEKEGRAVFRAVDGANTHQQLNKLLKLNGISVRSVKHYEKYHYYGLFNVKDGYSDIVEIVTRAKLPRFYGLLRRCLEVKKQK